MRRAVAVVLLVGVFIVIGASVFLMTKANKQDVTTGENRKLYVALGDSVAAGLGLQPYSDASACDRTDQSYPAVFAKENGYRLQNLACSSATVPAGVDGPQTVNNLTLDSQLDTLFRNTEKPELITLTIGANDIDWTRFIACYTTECPAELKQQVTPKYAELRTNLATVFTKLKDHYGTSMPRVAVTGYYQIIPTANKNCDETTGLDTTERTLLKDVFDGLNGTIEQTASSYDFVTYVPIDFSEHELCSAKSWIQGADEKAPLHPNADGQVAIAKQLADGIKSNK